MKTLEITAWWILLFATLYFTGHIIHAIGKLL